MDGHPIFICQFGCILLEVMSSKAIGCAGTDGGFQLGRQRLASWPVDRKLYAKPACELATSRSWDCALCILV